MHRLGLAGRLSAILIVAVLAIWLIGIVSFYRSSDWDGQNQRPSPEQIAAIATLVETTSPAEQPVLLKALSSASMNLRLDQKPNRAPDEPLEADEGLIRSYAPYLGGRPFTVSTQRTAGAMPAVLGVSIGSRTILTFRVGLKNGDTLIIDDRGPPTISRQRLPIGVGPGLIGTLVALMALVTMYRETRPLSQLARAVDRMDLAGTPVPLPKVRTSSQEIRAVVAAFDRLQTRLSHLLRARMAMIGGISHDVRTFATRLRLRVDLIPEGAERDRAISDISDMIRLLDDALLASRAGAKEMSSELLALDEIVDAEVEDRRAAGTPVQLQVEPNAIGANVLGDRLALRRIVANLVDNALKYGNAAAVGLVVNSGNAVLTIDDEGPGIAPEHRDLLLEPFVRMESSRNRETGGAGLGLAIVQNLVDAHDGKIEILDAPGGGTRVVVRIPLFVAAD